MLKRIAEVINPTAAKPKSMMETIQQTGLSIGGVVEHFDRYIPRPRRRSASPGSALSGPDTARKVRSNTSMAPRF